MVETASGIGFRILVNARTLRELPRKGSQVRLLCALHVREGAIELFGVLSEEELAFLSLLSSVSGVGLRIANAILGLGELRLVAAAIKEGKLSFLAAAPGVGKKIARRIVFELREKITLPDAPRAAAQIAKDADVVEALVNLGYRRREAREAVARLDASLTTVEERLRAALAALTAAKRRSH